MGRYGVFVWERGPKPKKRVVIETVGFINITIFSEVWRALEEPHLDRTVDVATIKIKEKGNNGAGFRRRGAVPVERCGVTGHEEEDVWLGRAGDAVDVTQRSKVAHGVQGAALVDQAGVQTCSEVAHQQEECSSPPP